MNRGTLTIVGTGIRAVSHLTLEAISYLRRADRILYLLTDPLTTHWIRGVDPAAESLAGCYAEGKDRVACYRDMVDRIVTAVQSGLRVCVALYGHPGVFARVGHEAVAGVRAEGLPARMLPGISAEDCLFADLGIDPGRCGCQSFEATDFVSSGRVFDPRSTLILWQVGLVGQPTYRREYDPAGVKVVADVLARHYPPGHPVTLYVAAQYPFAAADAQSLTLASLPSARVKWLSTLVVPPREEARPTLAAEAACHT